MSDISRGKIKVEGFKDPEMDFQLLRQLGSASYGGSSIGESLRIANQIRQGNPEDWVKEFEQLAEWQKTDGLQRLADDHIISGREQLLKAANAYRAAEYYSPCSSEHHCRLGLQSADCFAAAAAAMDLHFESHTISYNHINIPAYFISPENDGVKRKTIMIVSGFDGTMEEEFIMRGKAAIKRGYNVIHFAGPGQMDVFRKYQEAFFEPNFEQVVKRVIDHFEFRQEVDMNHLSLVGISLGGYFATRAASYEPRIKALIANSPIIDLFAYLASFTNSDPWKMADSDDFTMNDLPNIPEKDMPKPLKIQCEQLMVRFGGRSFKNTFEYIKEFTVGKAVKNIKCPSFAMIGASEGSEPKKQYDEFCNILEADSYVFNDFEGAGMHCQVGNISFANAVMYDWLEKL